MERLPRGALQEMSEEEVKEHKRKQRKERYRLKHGVDCDQCEAMTKPRKHKKTGKEIKPHRCVRFGGTTKYGFLCTQHATVGYERKAPKPAFLQNATE